MPLPTPETYEMLRRSIEEYLADKPEKLHADLPRIIDTAERRLFSAISKQPMETIANPLAKTQRTI